MKIVHFIPTLGTGGAETLVKEYGLEFSKEHDFQVLLFSKPTGVTVNEAFLKKKDIPIHYLEVSSQNKVVAYIQRIIALRTFLKKEGDEIDVLHYHLELSKFLVFVKKHLKNVKLVHTIHSEVDRTFCKHYKNYVDRVLIRKFIKHFNLQLIALHETMRQELNEMFGVTNTVVIRNGIDMERFNPECYEGQKQQLKESFGFSNTDYIVGHVGRLVEVKNHAFLLNVFSELLKQKPNAKLLLVGEGHLREELTTQIKALGLTDNVVMTGSRSDIPELLSIMDVFVFPSIYEGLGIVLVEAQAMGLKCVVSTAVPQEAHLTDIYIPVGLEQPVEEWCRAILDESLRTHPVDSLKNYDMREIVKQLEEFLKDDFSLKSVGLVTLINATEVSTLEELSVLMDNYQVLDFYQSDSGHTIIYGMSPFFVQFFLEFLPINSQGVR